MHSNVRSLDRDLKQKISGPGSVPIRRLLLNRLHPSELLDEMSPPVFKGTKVPVFFDFSFINWHMYHTHSDYWLYYEVIYGINFIIFIVFFYEIGSFIAQYRWDVNNSKNFLPHCITLLCMLFTDASRSQNGLFVLLN